MKSKDTVQYQPYLLLTKSTCCLSAADYLRQLSEEDDQMEVWPHTQKTILASCEAFCQINKDAGHWAPEWIAAKLLILEEQGNVYLANLINVPFFPHLIEYRPVFLPESDVPGWLPTGFNAATDL